MKKIKITAGKVEVTARLNETDTAVRVWEILPVTAHASVWGEEIYFSVPLETGTENAQEVVARGDVAYWPPGQALCLFFGKTPVSRGKEIRPYSPVNVIGRIEGDPKVLKPVEEGDVIIVDRVSEA